MANEHRLFQLETLKDEYEIVIRFKRQLSEDADFIINRMANAPMIERTLESAAAKQIAAEIHAACCECNVAGLFTVESVTFHEEE